MKRQLECKAIYEDKKSRLWKVTDKNTEKSVTFTVTDMGDVSFCMSARNFPYAEALYAVTCREGRKLHISVPKSNDEFKCVIEEAFNVTKVPCDGVSFQIYYLNP